LVNQGDRLASEDTITYLQDLLKAAQVVKDPQDDISAIFVKIQKWKQQFGNLDEQESAVSKKLRTKGLKIYNAKTLDALLKSL